MTHFALNLLLAIVWMLLFGDFSLPSLLAGLGVGFVAIVVSRPLLGSQRYVRAVGGTLRLALGFLWELVVANLLLARDILRPRPPFRPGFLAYDASDLGPTETVLLANLVSLTPGTVSVDLDDQGEVLHVHSLYAGDAEATRRGIRRLAELIHAALGEPPGAPEPEEHAWRPSSS